MRTITWLHISDFHFCEVQTGAQDAVLSAMLEDIGCRCKAGLTVDFVLVTGDLAFSGKEVEYKLVAAFFDKLSKTTGLSCERIFCIPGNHDVQRERYKTLFAGVRQKLKSENDVYDFLSDTEERNTLLLRQDGFSRFQKHFFAQQERERTTDDLGYVSFLEVDDLRIAIIGMNSAWLSEGGIADEGQILLGERQVQEAIDIAKTGSPHVIIGMQHHPFDFLNRFDRQSTQRRLEQICHLLHCGHLHEPNASQAVTHSGKCLTLAAGASFESRESRNAYSMVKFDPLHAKVEITFIQYDPSKSVFSYASYYCHPLDIDSAESCSIIELAPAIEHYCPNAADISYYLAALLLGDVSDVPVRTSGTVSFGSLALLRKLGDKEIAETTNGAMIVGRAVRLLHGRKSLDEILTDHGEPVQQYVRILRTLDSTDNSVWEQLVMRNNDAVHLADAENPTRFSHTLSLLDDLLSEGDWDKLRELSERYSRYDDPVVASKKKRMLALCLARSDESSDHQRAINLYREVVASAYGESSDWAALATLLANDGDYEGAKAAVMQGIEKFPAKIDGFVEVGMRIVETTGDIAFRDKLRTIGEGRK